MGDYENVPVHIRKTPDGKFYEVGTEINGQFQPFTWAGWTVSAFDAYVADAAAAQAAAASSATTEPESA